MPAGRDAQLYSIERWRDEPLDVPLWHARTEHMIALLARQLEARGERGAPLRLLELGCGAMAAERALLRQGLSAIEYLPADCFARDARTLVIDLEDLAAVRRLPRVDIVLLGGVLEYLSDPESVLRALAGRARYLFFSYCPRTPGQSAAARKGWKSHLGEGELERLARSLGEATIEAGFDARAPKPVRTYFVVTPTARRPAPACPLCRGTDSGLGHAGDLPLGDELLRQETRVCRACGLVFEATEPDQDWAGLYGDVWQRGAQPSGEQRALYAHDARLIGPGAGRRVFEVGCGAGLLLDELARLGWRTAGCDPEQAAVELARSRGHDVRAELFRPRSELASELVVLGDVLEHQADPLALLRAARSLVLPGGRLYLRVPDLLAIDFESFGDVFGLQHRVWFTAETLVECLALAGLEPVPGSPASFGRGLYALTSLAEPRPWRRPAGEPERSLEFIRLYARGLSARRAALGEGLGRLAGREVALYGGGEHARELLAFSPLGRIASRVADGNPALWGRQCGKLVIEAPARLREAPPDSIVIASRAYQDEIARELSDLAERGVEVIALYGPPSRAVSGAAQR
jgi:2-polyprenyl-3-methyl-5-hydroxy-6-metoxy-1,4-benzoquinol methylase